MIDKDQYNQWRNHPATLFFRKFLADRADMLGRELMTTWLDNPEGFEGFKDEARGRILELKDMTDVPYETIEEFYPKEKGNDAAEDTVDQTS